ncbi:MAG: DNA/RNA non-specific endonuclease [Culicoidibacterales bacterium]
MTTMKKMILGLLLTFTLAGCGLQSTPTTSGNLIVPSEYSNNKTIEVESCNLSGERKANVKVDIGYGDREYYAYTNEYGQLAYVQANEITLQTDDELAAGKKRYCNDEAKVPGTEAKNLDEGHVIADSLGGVGNAYNITPQESQLNRYGEQAEMERMMRDTLKNGGTVTDFVAVIEYADTATQIPESYAIGLMLDGEPITFDFFNVTE